MNIQPHTMEGGQLTVAQLAVAHPGALGVFTRYSIDYCCGGHRPLDEACKRIGLDPEKIMEEISQARSSETPEALRVENWGSSLLVDFIIQNHHTYVKIAIPEIQTLLDKVCDAHGGDSPHLLMIRKDFNTLAEELLSHMHKEEFVLFPAIKRLASQDFGNVPLSLTIQSPLAVMEHEHTVAGDLVKSIRVLSGNYTPPDFACPTRTRSRIRNSGNSIPI